MKIMEKLRKLLGGIMMRLVILYLALVFIVMIVSGTFIYTMIKAQEAEKAENELKTMANRIDEQILNPAVSGGRSFDSERVKKIIDEDVTSPIAGRTDMQYAILDSDGNTLISSGGDDYKDSVIFAALTGHESFEPWVKSAGRGNADARIRTWLNYARPTFYSGDEMQFVIFLSMDAEDSLGSLGSVTDTIIIAVALAIVLAVILGILFSSTITGPITSLTKIAGEMSKGDLNQQIPAKSDDEIGQLTQSFNNMAKSLSATISDMASEKNRIEIILNNMTDGVLAYDSENNLIHANYASSEMLEIADIEKKSFKEIMEILGLEAENSMDFENIEKEDTPIKIGDKFISVSYNAYRNILGAVSGVVFVFQDVTKHTKLDNMRKEFVANVSHEIRTPLTTIKTYTETLLDGAIEDHETAKSFLETIDSETDRMTFLATDLLELSRLDNKQANMQFDEVNLVSLVNNTIRQNSVLAQNKNQKLAFECEYANLPVICDPSRINQVLSNIISNSIKYSPVDSTITININTAGKHYKVFIKDEGMGIPQEDLQRIFERFYRVDKARSRQMGGTGLGLAIAKEIMDAHEGKISAVSEMGKGTTMIIRFKKPIKEAQFK